MNWLGLLITPLLFFPIGISPFEIPKVIFFQITTSLIFSYQLLYNRISLKSLHWNLLGLILLPLLQFFSTQYQLWGNQFRLQGLLFYWLFLLWVIISATTNLTKKISFVALFSLIILVGSAWLIGADESGRAIGLLGEANSFATIAVILGIISTRFLGLAPWGLSLIAIWISGSRSALIALFIVSIFLFTKTKANLTCRAILSLALIFASLLLPGFANNTVFESRLEIWHTALNASQDKPLLGWGIGNTTQALETTASKLSNNLRYQFVDHSHNIFLHFAVEQGLIGLILWVTLIYSSLKNLILAHKETEIAVLIATLTALSFNPLSVAVHIWLGWSIAKGLVIPNKVNPKHLAVNDQST